MPVRREPSRGYAIQHNIDKKASIEAQETLDRNRAGIVLTGTVRNGKVYLDEASLKAVSRKFADAELSFVAVNAPFDPQSTCTAS
jgi:hypothetical protein